MILLCYLLFFFPVILITEDILLKIKGMIPTCSVQSTLDLAIEKNYV